MTRPRDVLTLVRSACPECVDGELEHEPGYPDSRDEPGEPDRVYCPTCGWVCEDTSEYLDYVDRDYEGAE